jgi:two-component system sensor histidine kinase HydH
MYQSRMVPGYIYLRYIRLRPKLSCLPEVVTIEPSTRIPTQREDAVGHFFGQVGKRRGHQARNVVDIRTRPWIPVLLPFAVGLLGTISSLIATHFESWGPVLGNLYYIPIVIAAVTLGARSAVVVALAAGCAHAAAAAWVDGSLWVAPLAQTVLFVCVALTAAKLAQSRASRAVLPAEKRGELLATGFSEIKNETEMGVLSPVVVGLVRQFRTPVTSIEGAGWVLDDPQLPDDKRRELIGIIRKEAHRLNGLLSDVLDFTQPRRPRFRTINLSTIVDEVIQLSSPKDRRPRWIFERNVGPAVPALQGDPEQLRQVLLNLVVNSMEATPDGGQIEILAVVEDDKVILTVKDDGPGIPPDVIDKIFEPFFTTHARGRGLGLPTALRIVNEHGGSIALDRRQREGTCVSVTLPLRPSRPIR